VHTGRPPVALALADFDERLVLGFLDHLEKERNVSPRLAPSRPDEARWSCSALGSAARIVSEGARVGRRSSRALAKLQRVGIGPPVVRPGPQWSTFLPLPFTRLASCQIKPVAQR
jgi:hypothetical protein